MFTLITNPEKQALDEASLFFKKLGYAFIFLSLVTCCLLLTNKDLHAQEPENVQAWAAFVPPPDKYDWVQLTSGEWLKGEIKVLYDDVLEFDSDELDLLKLDMEDVKRIIGSGTKIVRLEHPTANHTKSRWQRPEPISVIGELEVTENKVIITSGVSEQVFSRSDLIAIVSGEGKESQYWSAKISIGLNLTAGNTEQTDYSSNWDIRRRTAANRFVLNYLGNYSRTRDVDTVDNNRLNFYIDVFKARQYYWRAIFGEYFRDPFQNIENRYTLGTGIGYHLIKTPKTEWDVNVGLAYQHTRFNSVEAGEDPEASTPALAIGTLYETALTKTLDFDVNYSFNIVNEESGKYTHHFVTTLETEITSWLDFDISFVWDRVQEPTANADGTVPEPDDYRLIFSLGIEY
jgi:putative salt-induced outer membrane protein YdiY